MATAKAPTTGVSTTTGKNSARSGKAKSGKQPKQKESEFILFAKSAEILLKSLITQNMRYMENRNTWEWPVSDGSVIVVTMESTKENSSARLAEKLLQNQKVISAIDALAIEIMNGLDDIRKTATTPVTSTTGRGTGPLTPKNISTKERASGRLVHDGGF